MAMDLVTNVTIVQPFMIRYRKQIQVVFQLLVLVL